MGNNCPHRTFTRDTNMKYFVRFFMVGLVIGMVAAAFLVGCAPSWWNASDPIIADEHPGIGGGQDSVTIHLPFDAGYATLCTQGVGGSYSHTYNSTYYGVDLDTPNNRNDYVFAPVFGIAYVHDDPSAGFGRHINIDLGDGTYIVVGHLEAIFVEDAEEVAAGQLIAWEGSTGASSGDHVHVGRQSGDAAQDASFGTSVEGLAFRLSGGSTVSVSDMNCDLNWGTTYVSALPTPRWHPNGTLVKTPESPDVYLLDDGVAYPFFNEASFWSRNYSFADLAVITEDELDCYGSGALINGEDQIRAVYDGSTVWMLFGFESDAARYRKRVRNTGLVGVLDSWGIHVYDAGDLETDAQLGGILSRYPVQSGFMKFREGTLVRETGSSAVYVVAEGVAQPILTWDVYLMLDYLQRYIIKVDPGAIGVVQGSVGNCSTGVACVDFEDVFSCGGVPVDVPDPDTGIEDTGDPFVDTGDPYVEDTGSPYIEDTGEGDTGLVDTGDPFALDCEPSDVLRVTWATASWIHPDKISMSGEYQHANSYTAGWQWDMVTSCGQSSLVFERTDAQSGDTFEFFVEYVDNNGVHEFCNITELAPLNGSLSVTYGGTPVNREVIPDPFSDVCTVRFTIP